MSLPHVILAHLFQKGELTGYDITSSFKGNSGLAWAASHQQVYRELGKLEADELCFHHIEPQEGRPDRKIFRLSLKGEKELKDWCERPVISFAYRDKLAVKVFASRGGNRANLINLLEKEIVEREQKIKVLECVSAVDVFDEILLDRRIAIEQCEIDWARSSVEKLMKS